MVGVLDDLRKQPIKFTCLNDNTDPNEEDVNKMVHAVLIGKSSFSSKSHQ